MKKSQAIFVMAVLMAGWHVSKAADNTLESGFADPPREVCVQTFWWWLNGNVTRESITAELEAMKEKGFGGALIVDAGGATQDGNGPAPSGPVFASPEWRKLYRHALKEGARLNLELALNIQSGWDLGGPGVAEKDAAKLLARVEKIVTSKGDGAVVEVQLPVKGSSWGDVAVLAMPVSDEKQSATRSFGSKKFIRNFDKKTLMKPVDGGNGDVAAELAPTPVSKGVVCADPEQVVDVTKHMNKEGLLRWAAPAGKWCVTRFFYTTALSSRVSTCSPGWEGWAIDPMDADAFQRYWDRVVEPLMEDAKSVKNCTLKYVHTDSWEIEPFNWTPALPVEFQKRRGYDMTPWLPVLAGRVMGGIEASERFLHDFRKTVGELTAENYYGPFMKNAHRHGLQVRAESGGPHGVPIDAQHCLGIIDAPMSEFWATSWRHRVPLERRFFIKQPASAAHTYGKNIVAAEGFTTIGPHWQETVWDNMKPNFDRAICEGLNQLVYHGFGASPKEQGLPGQSYFAGAHINSCVTWWGQSEGFFSYINRCQWMMRQGKFVADVLYYYGDLAPNFAGWKGANQAQLPPGYDYDIASEYVLLNRLSVKGGRMVLPASPAKPDGRSGDGMSYAALVLPAHPNMSLPVLRKLEDLVKAGGVIIGPRPVSSSGMKDWKKDGDKEARGIIEKLWGRDDANHGPIRQINPGEWVKQAGLIPDCAVPDGSGLDWIHRRSGDTDIYFVANLSSNNVSARVTFRISGKKPEYWNAVKGTTRLLAEYRLTESGATEVPLQFEPYGSCFVVFRSSMVGEVTNTVAGKKENFARWQQVSEITGAWDVEFDRNWFYPELETQQNGIRESVEKPITGALVLPGYNREYCKVRFDRLEDWTRRPEEAIKHYSGMAVYRKEFELKDIGGNLWLDLGSLREMAKVKVNGRDLGVIWCEPWRVEISGCIKSGVNQLEVHVVNFWPNRLIGDAKLPQEQRRTRTNIRKFVNPGKDMHYTTLIPSGLLGPVRVMREEP